MDERAGPGVARWLDMREHDVVSVFPDNRGLDDLSILQRAFAEDRIVVTCDKDYGELVYRLGQPHKGVVLLRLEDETTGSKIARLQHLLENFGHVLDGNFLGGNFVAATESKVRID